MDITTRKETFNDTRMMTHTNFMTHKTVCHKKMSYILKSDGITTHNYVCHKPVSCFKNFTTSKIMCRVLVS